MPSFLCYESGGKVTLYILYMIIVFSLHLLVFMPFFEGAITYLRAAGLSYTHLIFIIVFQIASDSAVSFKIKWPTKYSTLQVDLTYAMSLYISTYIKLCGSLKKCLNKFLLEFCTPHLGGVAKNSLTFIYSFEFFLVEC